MDSNHVCCHPILIAPTGNRISGIILSFPEALAFFADKLTAQLADSAPSITMTVPRNECYRCCALSMNPIPSKFSSSRALGIPLPSHSECLTQSSGFCAARSDSMFYKLPGSRPRTNECFDDVRPKPQLVYSEFLILRFGNGIISKIWKTVQEYDEECFASTRRC